VAVGVLLLTHRGLGTALIEAAHTVLGPLPLEVRASEFGNGDDVTEALHAAAKRMRELDRGEGVLVLTDLYGSTPSNLAAQIAHQGTRVRRVAGLNLPMLLRVLNYAELNLDELVLTAASGARNGVIVDQA
jgi:PTS system ascorbate-specific IIA component